MPDTMPKSVDVTTFEDGVAATIDYLTRRAQQYADAADAVAPDDAEGSLLLRQKWAALMGAADVAREFAVASVNDGSDRAEGSAAAGDAAGAVIARGGGLVVCQMACWPCLMGECPDGWHQWANADDVEFAAAQGTADPSGLPCGCFCMADRER